MDKYTIARYANKQDGSSTPVINKLDETVICDCTNYNDALLICKLLNENEWRKNQPRMSKLHKEIALQCLNAIRRNGIRPTDYNIKYLDEAIEIISNLPTGEN